MISAKLRGVNMQVQGTIDDQEREGGRSTSRVSPRGPAVKIIRDRNMLPQDHISPKNTQSRPSSAGSAGRGRGVSVGGKAVALLEKELQVTTDQQNTHMKGREKSIQSAAAIFVKSSWVPRNEEEVGYLEKELERIDEAITCAGGKFSKEGKKMEIPRHAIARRLAKYKAEQMRAARKAVQPPPPLPSEQQEAVKPLSEEARRDLDRAAGWRLRKGQTQEQSDQAPSRTVESYLDTGNSYSHNLYTLNSRGLTTDDSARINNIRHSSSTGDSAVIQIPAKEEASQLFGNRQQNFTRSYQNGGGFSLNGDKKGNEEAAQRIIALSERVNAMKKLNAEAAARRQGKDQRVQARIQGPPESITGGALRRGVGNLRGAAAGAASAPFANDLTWNEPTY